uniref:Uncharacterized protein n=1 Tax=Acanthochromis polyacanthus TaxID=80966 RepID=A0A3Q1GBA8_9TELE
IPIWSMTCCQLWEEPFFFRPAASCSLILMMRLAIPWTSSSLNKQTHGSRKRSGVLRMVAAILPPTRSPSPMFLRTAQASRSMSPLAKPW